ncbi:hypothetical protein QO034_14050 [Sedimentitalea sp. JM2-8]|uniref:Uncharacterized protein n=1 Tax=Sedimentitalea xiamensis TaxID=3050037 RepID=A0ABT7FGI2_9RHOB|nr:hypothetical protein [Sedimentitalea xiamensis]MDK3074237.1 hypothetical protein [Sedimentitalea xiamensis]
MPISPNRALFAVFVMLIVFSTIWRRNRLRRAVRNLPTRMQRLLGPEPQFQPPPDDALPDGLRAYAALHRRTRWVIYLCRAAAAFFAALILFLALKGTPS